ncbi:MAG: NAD(P)-binding domain-containing protein [bacterium]|nr:NAD(P)-binding domain-containing protein [bacterium]
MKKRIGILGSGMVGKALALGFAKHGYAVQVGTDSEEKQTHLRQELPPSVQVSTFSEAASFGEIVVLAVKGVAAESLIGRLYREGHLHHKTILDATNPIAIDQPIEEGVLPYFTRCNESLMERLQKTAPEANFVKCFSCVGAHLMVNPQFETKPTMFICGNHDQAKNDAIHILEEFGWDYEDCGSAIAARAIEPLAMLWCIPGFRKNQWMHAFKWLKEK